MQRSAIAGMLLAGIAITAFARPKPAGEQDAVMERVDRAAGAFRGMSAKVRRVSHTAVINEDTIDSGMIVLKRAHPRDVRMLIELTDPDPRTVAFQGHKLEIYYPKAATVQEIDMGNGKDRELLEQFLLLGFGTSRADLQASYNVRLVGPDTVGGQKTQRLELIPKSKEVLQHLLKFEMWVAENGYPIQQKFNLPGGDYQVATYSDMKINPDLPDSALKLNLPKGVKREYPQK